MSGAEILTGIGVGVGLGTAYGTIVDILRTGTTWAKWKAVGKSLGYPLMADVMQNILGAEKDEVHGLSTKGMIDAMWSFVDKTLDFSWIINEQIASQLFVQMIQQSIAYAIHSSHAGSIGTVCNVYSGSSSLSPMSSEAIGESADLADRGVKGFLGSAVGLNVPSVAFELTRGANARIEGVYRRIITQADSFLDEWNDLALSYYRNYHAMAFSRLRDALEMRENVVTRAYGFLEQVANEHLARISEQLDTLEGSKAWFDAGLMSDDEFKQIALRIDIERKASEDNFDDYKDEVLDGVETSLTEWDSKLAQALSDMKECEYRYSLLIKNIFAGLFADVRDFVTALCDETDKTIEDICAYRNVKQAVKVDIVSELGSFEASPEVEAYRPRWRKWEQIPNYTVIQESQKPTGIPWQADIEHDMGFKVPVVVDVLTLYKWKNIEAGVIIHHYESPLYIPWESVT